MQSMFIRNIRLHAAQCRQLSMLCRSYTLLKRRREAERDLATHCKALRELLQKAKESPSGAVQSKDLNNGTTKVLRIQGVQDDDEEVVLYVGHYVRTPMGEGKIIALDVSQRKATIQLSFGTMYSSFSTILAWWRQTERGLDCTSEDALVQHWESLRNQLSLPVEDQILLNELLCGHASLDALDPDEVESFLQSAALPVSRPLSTAMEVDDTSMDGSTADTNNLTLSQQSEVERVERVAAKSKTAASSTAATATGAGTATGDSAASAVVNKLACRTRAAGNSELDRVVGKVFPLSVAATSADNSVLKARKFLHSMKRKHSQYITEDVLPLAFVQPGKTVIPVLRRRHSLSLLSLQRR